MHYSNSIRGCNQMPGLQQPPVRCRVKRHLFCIDPRAPDTFHERNKTFQKELFKHMSQFDYFREKLRCLRDRNPADLSLRGHRAVT